MKLPLLFIGLVVLVSLFLFNDTFDGERVIDGLVSTEITFNTDWVDTDRCIDIVESSGKSMEPFFIGTNMIIIDTCFENEDLQVDDIIVIYKPFGQLGRVMHRVVDIDYEDEWVRTRGDNNYRSDDLTGFDLIYGLVIGYANGREEKVPTYVSNITFSDLNISDNYTFNGGFYFNLTSITPSIISQCIGYKIVFKDMTNQGVHWTERETKFYLLGGITIPDEITLGSQCSGLTYDHTKRYTLATFPLEDDCIEGTPHCFVKWDIDGGTQ